MNKQMIKLFLKSIFGGISISIANFIYLQTRDGIGSILFSLGLLMILNMDFKLFTGTIGYISKNSVKKNMIVLLGNIIGCIVSFVFYHPAAKELIVKKLSNPLEMVFAKSIICGILIYVAVECFKRGKDYMVPLCVSGFILFGAEHCIADLCYIFTARMMSVKIIMFLIVVMIGNSAGAILTHILRRN